MARGGKRTGAGRKPGSVGRANAEVRKKAMKSGISPLDYMLKVMRNPKADIKRRDDMAKAAAPYCHSRLSSVEVGGPDGSPIQVVLSKDDAGLL